MIDKNIHLIIVVGPMGGDGGEHDLYWYPGLPEWATEWDAVLFKHTKGEGRAFLFEYKGSDTAFPSDIDALISEGFVAKRKSLSQGKAISRMTYDEFIVRMERLEGRVYNLDKQYIDLKSMVGSVRASISKLAERLSRSIP